jgi:photosystem II stability/assembly factor-like uncharacterized protein
MKKSSPFTALSWQFLGPSNFGGRVNEVTVAEHHGIRRTYVAFSGSGLWSFGENSNAWTPLFVDEPTPAVTSVTVAPSNPEIVWILTGTWRSPIPLAGAGVFKSTNGGRTWRHMGLTDIGEGSLGKIVVHPRDPNIVYVAASGNPRASNLRGVFKTTDGGEHWARVFDRGVNSGVWQLVMDREDPEALYVATHARVRGNELPLVFADSEAPSLFKTTNGGTTWTEITSGLREPGRRIAGPNGGRAIAPQVGRQID